MPDQINKIRSHVVMVNDGSGVFIQSARGNQSYILTAKHVLETEENSSQYFDIDKITVKKMNGDVIDLVSRIVSTDHDLAVLITSSDLASDLQIAVSKPERNKRVFYYGYPSIRRELESREQLREYPGLVNEIEDDRFSVTLDGRPGWSEVVGSSGGGIFVELGGDIFLQGIESRVEGVVDREFHGKVICTPVAMIEKLLSESGLDKIHPPSMTSFIGLVDKTFQCFAQAEDPNNLTFLMNQLHERGSKLSSVENMTPFALYEKFKKRLLIRDCPEQNLYNENLWIAYLEFLIISSLIDDITIADFSYIDENSTRRRFLFSTDRDNWIWKLMDIFRSDFKGLKLGGKIIVSTGDSAPKHEARKSSLDRVVIDIGRGQKSEMMVDSGITNPAIDFKVYHLAGLHKLCVVDDDENFAGYYAGSKEHGEVELMARIKDLYNAYI
ncbi:ABC-three component system protein [Citrobacter freundii]|uniref:ABC-three component system protein n=1 Tax=Citrobacter sp. S44_ASV_140 TaxID=2846982 RepID=UPI001C1068E2|nr:ABC-three component system protein [Citrobacter sp. S44_ASV_140]MBU5684617.1 serine protease [Citrobacter sp. S44_ASV_140]HCA5746373.1 trypsin-like peptidase domain-containing protein [Citrobacter freundii]HCJ7770742.1 trypsin-like peptidase domain-containing protein [Citrobacter freundii]